MDLSLDEEVVELARLRAGDDAGPVRRNARKRARRVEGAPFLEAERRAVALGNLSLRTCRAPPAPHRPRAAL